MAREVWITGIGLTSSLGEGLDAHWQAMGVAIGGHFAYIWFGKAPDPTAAPQS